jgi:hypothetical protein
MQLNIMFGELYEFHLLFKRNLELDVPDLARISRDAFKSGEASRGGLRLRG